MTMTMTTTTMTPQEIGDQDPNMRRNNSTWPVPRNPYGFFQGLRGFLFGPRRYGSGRSAMFPGGFKALGSRALQPAHVGAVGFFARRRLALTGMLPGETSLSLSPDTQSNAVLDTLS